MNVEVPTEKEEVNALFQASDGVKAAEGRLAAVTDTLLTAVVVEAVVKAANA